MNTLSGLTDKTLVVWGAGIDGRAAVAWLAPCNRVTLVVDDPDDNLPAQQLAAEHGIPLTRPTTEVLFAQDLIVRAPGVSRYRPDVLAPAAAGVPSSNLAALWMADDHAGTIIGVTGTKGKSTTSHLTALLLRAAGYIANLGGNIGVPVLELDESAELHVVEISSYMAADMERSPDIGVLTNLGEDHLTWHGSIERYRADKLNLFAHDRLRRLIVSGADETAVAATASSRSRIISGTEGWVVGDGFVEHESRRVDLSNTPLARMHFALDLCAALTAVEEATSAPIPLAAVESVVADYRTLPSRLEPVATIDGVEYIDDALASNPFSACAALAAYPDRAVVLLLGGEDRGVNLSPLIYSLRTRTAPVSIILFSQTIARFAAALDAASLGYEQCDGDGLDSAVHLAHSLASTGTVVLFSPSVPTPVAVGNYRDRSRLFKAAVASLSIPPI